MKNKYRIEKRKYIKSSSFAMAMLFTILCGGVSLSLGYFINYFTIGHFVHSTKAALDSEIRYIDIKDDNQELTNHDNIIYITNQNILKTIQEIRSPLVDEIFIFQNPNDDKKYAAKIYKKKDGKDILVGLDISEISSDFAFMQIMGISSIIFVMLVVFVSYVISVFVVSNTNKIANTAKKIIETGDLSRRVEINSKWDDLSNMTIVLNQLLDRVEDLMKGIRCVSDNIAHDLRTPLTRLYNKIEYFEKRNDDSNYTLLKKEVLHLLDVFNALLRISRIETEKQKSQFLPLNLKTILYDVIEFYTPILLEKNIQIEYKLDNVDVYGDRDFLFQAYANLIDNAVKFTNNNGRILIQMNKKNVHISNTFEKIDNNEIDKLFDRFYRVDKSRNTEGTGLGLSLVKAIIELHEGTVKVESNDYMFTIITSL